MSTEHPTSPAVRVATVAAVTVVAGIAAVVSYSHMAQLADRAGEAWRAYLIPLSVDGLVVAASMVLLTRRRNGLPGGPLAWCALGGGVLASLAANMLDARPEVTAVLVAGWPAVAFAVAFELLLQQRRADRPAPAAERHAPAPTAPTRSDMGAPTVATPVAVVVPAVEPIAAPVSVVSAPAPAGPTGPEPLTALSKANAVRAAFTAIGTDDVPAVLAWLTARGVSTDRSHVYAIRRSWQPPKPLRSIGGRK